MLIAGSIGPLGTSVEVVGGTSSSGAGLYGRQAAVLEGRGVDLIVLETFTSLEELTVALDAVRAQTHLPVIAQITVQDDGETVTGTGGEEAARVLGDLGAAAVGINCSLGPQSALAGLREMCRSATTPLTVQPNVGLPMYRDGRVLYPDASEAYAAEFAAQAVALGARLVGGCCGTQPHHVAAIRRAVDEHLPARYTFARREPPPPTAGRSHSRCEPPGTAAGGRGVGGVGRAGPAQGRQPGTAAGHGGRDPGRRLRRVLRHQRQPDGACADELADDLDAGAAASGRGDDPAPDAARHHRPRPRVAAAGGARRRDPKPAGGDRRLPAAGRPRRLRRRLPGGRDRPRRDRVGAERGHRPRREDPGRADRLLHRRRGQSDGRRHRGRAGSVPAQGGRRARGSR